MVQIIESNRKPTTTEKFTRAFSGISNLIGEHAREKKIEEFKKKEDENLARFMEEEYKVNTKGLPKDFQKEILKGKQGLEQEEIKGKFLQDRKNLTPEEKFQELERYNVIKDQFGQEAADLYKSAPEGGKTELIKQFVDSKQRGLDVSNLLKKTQDTSKTPGYTPKEEVGLGKERYAKNLPLYQERQTKVKSLEDEQTALGILEELSPQISGLTRLNLNPQSGELIIPALASPEAQRYIKTINDFTTKAKDSYGSRVTNFDLTQFMKRLPTLANTEEGRKEIIEQMRTLNSINMAREQALINYVDEQGGVRNVDWDRAEREADKRSKNIVDELKKDFIKIESNSKKSYTKSIDSDRKLASQKGLVLMELNGENIFVPKSDVSKAKKRGAKPL